MPIYNVFKIDTLSLLSSLSKNNFQNSIKQIVYINYMRSQYYYK